MSIAVRANGADFEQKNGIQASGSGQNAKAGRQTVFAGDLGLNGAKSQIDMKRENAQKQAMKLVSDAWGRDKKCSDNISNMRGEKEELLSDMRERESQFSSIDESKAKLQQEYGVEADSEEQKDLELLERYQDYKNHVGPASFTKEEIERLKQLQDMPRTEYQQEMLMLNGYSGELRRQQQEDEWKLKSLTASIFDAKEDQLKSQDMLKASDAADEIKAAVEKEIFGLLIEEGKEHIEEEQKEQQEKAEEASEEKEERDERLEEAKERRKEQEELLRGENESEQMQMDIKLDEKGETQMAEAQKSIRKILEENNLIDEDLKGIKIDFNF